MGEWPQTWSGIPTVIMLWVTFGVLLGVLEIFTAGFFCLFFTVGAFAAAIAAWFAPDNMPLQLVLFFLVSLLSLVLARPILKKTLNLSDKPPTDSNVDALLNQRVIVLEPVEAFQGKVKIVHTGEIWSAYWAGEDEKQVLEPGAEGRILRVDGAKLAIIKY